MPKPIAANIVMLIGALALLVGSSSVVLEYAVKLAESLGVSELVIGLTIVSLGTSFPEIFTSINSAALGHGDFILGDIYGSYITQLTLFLGIVVLAAPMTADRKAVPYVLRDGGLMLCALLLLSFNVLDGQLTRLEAGICIGIYIIYIIYLLRDVKKHPDVLKAEIEITEGLEEFEGVHKPEEIARLREREIARTAHTREKRRTIARYGVLLAIGAVLCYAGAFWVVESGTALAHFAAVPEYVIAATIVGFGTGFPELVVSFLAIKKKRYLIAYGNLIGSNIVDPLLSVPLGAMANPLVLQPAETFGIMTTILPVAIIVDIVVILIFSRKKSGTVQGRLLGLTLVGLYAAFIIVNVI
jgi:cation:H+ antiporter